jgi:hypothetical protein
MVTLFFEDTAVEGFRMCSLTEDFPAGLPFPEQELTPLALPVLLLHDTSMRKTLREN